MEFNSGFKGLIAATESKHLAYLAIPATVWMYNMNPKRL